MTTEHGLLTVPTMEIRRAGADDWATLKSIRLAALRDAPDAFGSTYEQERQSADEWWREWAQKSELAEDRVSFLAFHSARCVGMVAGFASTDDADSATLGAMWVAPSARRRGVGRALIEAVVAWAAGVGRRRVVLWVANGSVDARDLYAAVGFEPTGEAMPLPSNPSIWVAQMERVVT